MAATLTYTVQADDGTVIISDPWGMQILLDEADLVEMLAAIRDSSKAEAL